MILKNNIKKNLILAFIFLFCVIFAISRTNFELNTQNQRVIEYPIVKPSGYWNLTGSPIFIDDADPNYNWSKTAKDNDWCSGSGTWNDPYIIENVTIDGQLVGSCITIQNSSAFFIIRNCTLTYSGGNFLDAGLYLNNVSNSIISNNTFSWNYYAGICLYMNCINNTIQGNKCYAVEYTCIFFYQNCSKNSILNNKMRNSGGYGIRFGENIDDSIIQNNFFEWIGDTQGAGYSIYLENNCDDNIISNNDVLNGITNAIDLRQDCDKNLILNNFISNHDAIGILLYRYCDNNTIFNNTVSENGNGIFPWERQGIILYDDCDENNVSQNVVNDNDDYGIYLREGSGNNTISENTFGNAITSDQMFGIYSVNSDDNIIKENIFLNNTQRGADIDANSDDNLFYLNFFLSSGIEHARDLGSNNNWNSSTIGNFWDTYVGVDDNQDGIGDLPYNFGTGIDYLPIYDDDAPNITIFEPNMNQVYGINAPNFAVEIRDLYLGEMWYSVDYGKNITFYDNGTIDQIEWNNLVDGMYDITFYANDIFQNEASKSVTVVKDIVNPTIYIIAPMTGTIINTTTLNFIVEIYDDHLDTMWYTINSGATKYFFTNNGTIQGWLNYPNGPITIRFYANDTAGNVESEHTTVIKDLPPTDGDGGRRIPGYDTSLVYATFLALLCIILVLNRKNRKLKAN